MHELQDARDISLSIGGSERTEKLVKGMQNTAPDTGKQAAIRSPGDDEAFGNLGARVSSTSWDGDSEDDSGYDREAAVAAVEPTESRPLLAETKEPSRRVDSLWGRLRQHRESLAYHVHSMGDDDQDSLHRSQVLAAFTDNVRSALNFTLTQCMLAIFVYLAVAALSYSFIFEKWPIVDSLYFACVTFTTIGYGDLVPTSDSSRLFTAFFALSGVACLGIALGVLGSNLIDAQVQAIDRARDLRSYQVTSLFNASSRSLGEASNEEEEEETKTESKFAQLWHRSSFALHSLSVFALLMFCCWLLGNAAEWNGISTFYVFIVTACTIGYGDFSPQTQAARLGAVVFIPVAVGAMGQWLSLVANAMIERRQAKFQKHLETHELTMEELNLMDDDGDGRVTQVEFISFLLVAMKKVDQSLIDDLTTLFNRLDVAGTGMLEREDLILVAKRKLQSPRRKLELAAYKKQLLSKSKERKDKSPIRLMDSLYPQQ